MVIMSAPGYREQAAAGMAALQRWYRPSSGLWRTAGWWNAANALTAVIAYTGRTGDQAHAGVIETTFRRAPRRNADFVNKYYDDNLWWGLAWAAAFDLTGEVRYLDAARVIFERCLDGWDDTCGGGLWWSRARKYKNAITNELFLTLAARLHQRVPGDQYYLDWALREWEWFQASGMISPAGLVNDGLTDDCANNGGITWTYNQGVILGGLAALHEITGDPACLARGEAIADAALRALVTPDEADPPGILTEPLEASTSPRDGDRPQFKGIFVRHLHDFARRSGRPAYPAFIEANARAIWTRARNERDQFGLCWSGPFDRADASRQSAALDVLNAAVGLAG
jgi:predicted alpha-1,6-mannanase (GH76 family)